MATAERDHAVDDDSDTEVRHRDRVEERLAWAERLREIADRLEALARREASLADTMH